MILDIYENLGNIIYRSLADYTKINVKIKTKIDMELLKQDLDNVYRWATKNLWEFNLNKCKIMSHKTKAGKNVSFT